MCTADCWMYADWHKCVFLHMSRGRDSLRCTQIWLFLILLKVMYYRRGLFSLYKKSIGGIISVSSEDFRLHILFLYFVLILGAIMAVLM